MGKVSKDVRKLVLDRDGDKCSDCGTAGDKRNPLQMHHIVWRSRGGSNEPENLRTMCKLCHIDLHQNRR